MKKINLRFQLCQLDGPCEFEHALIINGYKLGNLLGIHQYHYRFSQIIESMIDLDKNQITIENFEVDDNSPYIFATAVGYGPYDYTDLYVNQKSVFEYLPEKLLNDLRNKKALLLLDQSVEGYSDNKLWSWFHNKCTQYNLNPESIMYSTGDQSCTDSYNKWCNDTNYNGPNLLVFPSTTLFFYVKRRYDWDKTNIDFDDIIQHKKINTPKYLYDCFMLRPRPHRILTYLHLFNNNLLDKGNIGMADISEWGEHFNMSNLELYSLPNDVISKLPINSTARKIEHQNNSEITGYHDYAERLLTTMYKNSWVTLVVETTFFKQDSVFISEKTIKPIACMQPFLVVGSKGTLKYLRKLGYKTFHPIIDESYDDIEDEGKRLEMIMKELKKIENITDKISWMESMRNIIEHNFKLFMQIRHKKSNEHDIINNYYFNYFKEDYVS